MGLRSSMYNRKILTILTISIITVLFTKCGLFSDGNTNNEGKSEPVLINTEADTVTTISGAKFFLETETYDSLTYKYKLTEIKNNEELLFKILTTKDFIAIAFSENEGLNVFDTRKFTTTIPDTKNIHDLAKYILASVRGDTFSGSKILDSPGCDLVPDIVEGGVLLRCCAKHDACYDQNGCSFLSWMTINFSTQIIGLISKEVAYVIISIRNSLDGIKIEACNQCNLDFITCLLFSRNEDDRCYDNVCSEFYDCGRNDCDCSPCGTKTKNHSAGDVHLVTPDGLAFDFQGAGEFLLLKSSDGKIEIQTRQEPWFESDRVTVNTAVAMNVNGDRVGIYLNKLQSVIVNGNEVSLTDYGVALPNGGFILKNSVAGETYSIIWPDGFVAGVKKNYGSSFLNVGVQKNTNSNHSYSGLIGNYDGDPKNDFADRNGEVFPLPIEISLLYSEFGNSWRISQEESLFDYEPNTNTETYTILDFPKRAMRAEDLPSELYLSAEKHCSSITDEVLRNNCILDVAMTNELEFVESSTNAEIPQMALPIRYPVYFDKWNVKNIISASGQWVISDDGQSVNQTNNTNYPTFFVSPEDFIDHEITGTIRINDGSDDDFVGFVLGFNSVRTSGFGAGEIFDFILLDWKRGAQEGSKEGFTLSQVMSNVDLSGSESRNVLWTHDNEKLEILASRYGSQMGWQPNVEYVFEFKYTSGYVSIVLNGEDLFRVEGEFKPGSFGFYNLSQANVDYYGFSAIVID